MKNKMADLNDHLFEAMEWLGDRDLKGDDLAEEIRRAEAKCKVAQQIIANGTFMQAKTKNGRKAEKNRRQKMKIELADDGYEKIDRAILEIENLAYGGIFTDKNPTAALQGIISEAKKLRQTLREILLLVPDADTAVSDGKGDAA